MLVGLVVLVTLQLTAVPTTGAAPAEQIHYPDLRTEPPSELKITSSSGTKELRFANRVYNAGDGRLELKPNNNGSTQRTEVDQRLYSHTAAGVWYVATQRRAGAFTFHSAHNHWHFERFALYELRQANADGSVGSLVRSGEKTTFCVMDTYKTALSLEHAATTSGYSTCGTQSSNQGISVGWGDRYGPDLAGQSLDISTVPDGVYWLQSTADYRNMLAEKDENNNAAATKIRITGTTVTTLGTSTSTSTTSPTTTTGPTTTTTNPTTTTTNPTTTTTTSPTTTTTTPTSGAAIAVSPTSVDFGVQRIMTTSAARTVTVSSTGTSNLVMSSVSVSGTNASEFRITSNTCTGVSLAPSATCRISLTFSPSVFAPHGGTRTATLTISSNRPAVSVPLRGTSSYF